MTVHASKGLEFPIVFVVNLSRGTGNWRDAIRIAGETGDDVSVSVGDFESPADEDEPEPYDEDWALHFGPAHVVWEDGNLDCWRFCLEECDGPRFANWWPPALEAVRRWRYAPAMLDGRPVRVAFLVRVEFTLQ